MLEAAFGQSEDYVDQYLAKACYKFDVAGTPLTTSYQFYGACDKEHDRNVNNIYDGTGVNFGYNVAEVLDLCLEGTRGWAQGQ